MTIAILIVIVVVIVIVVGLLVYRLVTKAQTVVPDAADARDTGDRVVGTDEQGQAITEAQEPQDAPRDESGFESLLKDEIHDLGMEQPPDDEGP